MVGMYGGLPISVMLSSFYWFVYCHEWYWSCSLGPFSMLIFDVKVLWWELTSLQFIIIELWMVVVLMVRVNGLVFIVLVVLSNFNCFIHCCEWWQGCLICAARIHCFVCHCKWWWWYWLVHVIVNLCCCGVGGRIECTKVLLILVLAVRVSRVSPSLSHIVYHLCCGASLGRFIML